MSRRAPPRDYDDQDEFYEMEGERERDHRPHRRHREYEEDLEYLRRRSEPLVEDMKRMHIRERPRRDFMEESFAPPRARDDVVLMRSREELDMVSPERYMPLDHDDTYMRPSGSRRRARPREVDEEDLIFEKRERRRGSRRHPRDVDDGLISVERERRGDRRHRPEREREVEEDLFIDERERRRDRRYRPERASEEDLLFEERARERGSGRRRPLEPEFEEDDELILERERRRGSRRHPRESEEDELIIEDREIHRGSRRHPERRSEDDLLFEEREKRHRRRRPEREFKDDLLVEGRGKHGGRRDHPEREFEEEEMAIRWKREEPPLRRGWDSELDIRSRERRLEFKEEPYHRPRPRPPPPQRVEVEEVLLDNAPAERHRSPIDLPDRESQQDDVAIRRKDKGPRSIDCVDEEIVMRGRERRRSVPSEDLERELRGLRREDREQILLDEELSVRSQLDSKSRSRDLEQGKEEISTRKTKDKFPSRQPSPSLDSIHVPPIPPDVFTHDRHINHGYKDAHTPRMRSPETRPRRGSFDEIDIHHRKRRGGRKSDESIVLKHSDSEDSLAPEDSISPTSGPALDFNDPWERETITATRRRAKPLEDESELAYSREIRDAPSTHDVEKDIMIESTRLVSKAPRGTDDWSVVHAPSPDEAIEMTGALDVVEVKPRHAPVDEAEIGRIAQQVTGPEQMRNDRWTEIAKRLVVREAIEQMGFEYEETRTCYYIFSYLKSDDIDELIELSDEIRSARRRRIRDIQRERASVPDIAPRIRPRVGMPPRARMIEKRMQDIRDREWIPRRFTDENERSLLHTPTACVSETRISAALTVLLIQNPLHVINMSNASASTVPSGSSELGRSSTVVRSSDERFNIQSPQRRILIRQFKKAVFEQEIPSPLWAVLQLCDLEKLEYMVQLARFSLKIMDTFAELICALPFKWSVTPSPSQQLEAAYWSPTFSPRRRASPVAIYAARERDGYKCVITGTRKIYQTTPIFPASAVSAFLQNEPETPNIWRFADVFWGTSTTSRWKKAVFNDPTKPDIPVSDCSNLICLRRDLRTAWSSGLFALRPIWISDDMTEMEIEFYWQPKPDHKLFDTVDVAKEPPSTKNVNSVDRLIIVVGKRGEPTYRAIESGYRFRMTTDDPISRPLPSFDLLDMQWHFTRLTALCAAASFFDDDNEDEDDARSDKTTQPDHPLSSNPPDDDILAWVKSSLSPDEDSESDFIEDIDASMIGPLPESDTIRSRAVSETSKSFEKSAGSAGSADSESLEDSDMVDVISGTGHLAVDFREDS
ncbi:unnamed protein product [Penicillium egyptiacum]|uniref:DUF8035 domain-containing protein n=1 Tax=Penicillium egyptiacum TaxID=1303716 RepID=A0A9W4P3N1_9EURO|nr:unnamed protein product [Penicillium egyptiacum]